MMLRILFPVLTILFIFPRWVNASPLWPPQIELNQEILDSIERVYIVSSCHLDLGFADTLVNIVNRYFDNYFPKAIEIAEELRQYNHKERLVFTTHSYLVWLYFNCPLGSGLHCPSQTALDAFRTAVSKGDIVWHAFPFNAQPEVYDKSIFEFGFQFTANISEELGFVPVAMSQRDVPGLTRSTIPLMQKYKIDAITVGVNTACMPPAVPTAFKWLNEETNTQVIGMWHPHGYGGTHGVGLDSMVIVPGMPTALAFAIRGDNSGPPSGFEVITNFQTLNALFPNAEIIASSYNNFVEELIAHQDLLPVYKQEIGDTWIHGVASDPWRTTQYREMLRQRNTCLDSGKCSLDDQRFYNFSSFLLKYGEHTWGKDIKTFLHDSTNWSNEKFHAVKGNTSNYQDVVNSWIEQRDWPIKYAIEALGDHPLSLQIIDAISELYFNGTVSMDGFKTTSCKSFDFGDIHMSFNNDVMSIISLQDHRGSGEPREYSGPTNPLGVISYTTYTYEDYEYFLSHYLLDPTLKYAYQDLGKPGLSDTKHIIDTVRPISCWTKTEQDISIFRIKGSFTTSESVEEYGASQSVIMDIEVPTSTAPSDQIPIQLTMYIVKKTSTRIPESLSVLFKPNTNLVDAKTLSVSKLGEYVNVLDVITNGSKHVHSSDKGVKYGDPVPLMISSWDTNVVSIGGANVFPVPMETPDVDEGFGFNIFNNLWGTNYIMWYPYLLGEESGRYRFTITLPPTEK